MQDDGRAETRSWLREDAVFLRRLLATLALLALCYLVWLAGDVLILAFAAVVVSVLLRSVARLIQRVAPLSRGWALAAATLLVAGIFVLCGALFGTRLSGQLSDLWSKLPAALDKAGERFGIGGASELVAGQISQAAGGSVLSRVAGVGSTAMGIVADLALIIVAGIYLAADPGTYREGLVKMLPPRHHGRVLDAMNATGRALELWCAGQLATMAIVGTASTVAFLLIGLPSALGLGFLAALTNFIPFVGPLLGAVPALVVASLVDLPTVGWTLGAVFVIQQIEGNLVTPLIQKKAVLLAPALVLFALTIAWVLFGAPGLILAVPLTVTVSVFVKKMWIRETLGEETPVPGERSQPDAVA